MHHPTLATPSLMIRRNLRYRSLTTKAARACGEVICAIPSEDPSSHPTQFTVQVAADRHIEVRELSSMNHSCEPSVVLDTRRLLVIAARPLAPGDELTFFYPSTEWEMNTPFICLCGAQGCIHVVAGARFLPISTLERYYLNPHIRELLISSLGDGSQHMPSLATKP